MLFANESLLRKITIECHKVVPRFNAKTSPLAFKATSSDAYVILIESKKKIIINKIYTKIYFLCLMCLVNHVLYQRNIYICSGRGVINGVFKSLRWRLSGDSRTGVQ